MNGDGEDCLLYKGIFGSVAHLAPEANPEWSCYNMTALGHEVKTSTNKPLSEEEIQAEIDALPKLEISVESVLTAVYPAHSASVLTYNAAQNTCFEPFNVLRLEDSEFNPVAVKVPQNDWMELLKLIPSTPNTEESWPGRRLAAEGGFEDHSKNTHTVNVSLVLSDRVLYGGPLTPATVAPTVAPAAPTAPTAVPPVSPDQAQLSQIIAQATANTPVPT